MQQEYNVSINTDNSPTAVCVISLQFTSRARTKRIKEVLLGRKYTFFFRYLQCHFHVICVLGLIFFKKDGPMGCSGVFSVPQEDGLRVKHAEAWNCMFHLQAEVRRMNLSEKDD